VQLVREPAPELGPDDVRVEAIASAISHGTEMLVYRGQVPPEMDLDLPTLRGSFTFPIKYGYAIVGRVMEAGARVRTLRIGDPVFALHPHQSTFVVPASYAVRLPREVDPLLGVFLANIETALTLVLDAAPRLGERVLVFGAGVVGLLVTQLLRRSGITTLVVVDPIARRRALALELGADLALTPEDVAAGRVADCTGGNGVDVAVEASGSVSALDLALPNVAFGATIVVGSWYGTKPVSLMLGGAFHRRRLRLISSQVGSIDAALQPRWTHARRLDLARELLPRLRLRQLISHRFSLADAAAAYLLVDEHPEQTVQVVLTYR
jgi:2-desacetyl-2-hydroxyethyl bacteriochlorophyllide A dehydrogenase